MELRTNYAVLSLWGLERKDINSMNMTTLTFVLVYSVGLAIGFIIGVLFGTVLGKELPKA